MTAAGRSARGTATTGGSGGKTTTPYRVRRSNDLPAIHRPVLAVKGSLRRAKIGRALDGSGPFRRKYRCDGRLRRENHPKLQVSIDTQRLVSDPPAVPRLSGAARRRSSLPMCPCACFEAGRFTQTQSSWTAVGCSRKWMSGHAIALTHYITDRKRSTVALTVGFIHALQILQGSAGRVVFSLDKYLSWMPHWFRKPLISRVGQALSRVPQRG